MILAKLSSQSALSSVVNRVRIENASPLHLVSRLFNTAAGKTFLPFQSHVIFRRKTNQLFYYVKGVPIGDNGWMVGTFRTRELSNLYLGNSFQRHMYFCVRTFTGNSEISDQEMTKYLQTKMLQFTDGTTHTGEFLGDKFHGKGVRTDTDGKTLDGYWFNGVLQSGEGILRSDGFEEEGKWVNGMLVGLGRRVCWDGTIWKGEFVRGKLHGTGEVTYATGESVQGVFRNGRIYAGTGTLCLPDGFLEEGAWKDGQLTGKGRRRTRTGVTLIGTFKEGVIADGKVTYPPSDDCVVEGEFRDGEIYNGPAWLILP